MSGVDDRYTIPGSGGVLRNQFGLTTTKGVEEAMNENASAEWAIMCTGSAPMIFDFAYLAVIHQRLIGRVVGDQSTGLWAGQIRSGAASMGASGTGIVYCEEPDIQQSLDDLFGQLARENYLTGLDDVEFFGRLAERWGYLTTGGSALSE